VGTGVRRCGRGSAILAMGMAVALQCVGCSPCDDEVVVDSASPKGPQRVRVIVRNCGATTSYLTLAQAKQPGMLGRWTDVLQIVGRPVVEVRWKSVGRAVVAYAQCAPGQVAVISKGVGGLVLEAVDDPLLGARCGTNGYWEPEPPGGR
jgi:hypothetical protein